MAQTDEQRWAAWWAKYPSPDDKRAVLSWWSRRPVSYSSAKWYGALDDAERDKVQEAIRYQRGPLSGSGSASERATYKRPPAL